MDSLELVALAVWCFTVALLGGLVGIVLGNMRLPAVVLVASSAAAGAGTNLGISGVSALSASAAHIRAGRVNWRLFAWMAPPSMAGAVAGGLISGALPEEVLLVVIAVALLYFGFDLLRSSGGSDGEAARARPDQLDIRAAVVSGALIGLLGGLIGLILGSLRMPSLIKYVGETPARAVGTNLTVGVCVGAAGLVGHLPTGIDWDVFAVGAAASVPGALLGARLTGRLSERQLLRALGGVLIAAALAMVTQAVV